MSLLSRAHDEAVSADEPGRGVDRLVLAILDEGAGLAAELLRQEGLKADDLAAAPSDPDNPGLDEVARVAHEHAVMFESEAVDADHLLLSILILDKGRTAEILSEWGATERIGKALTESLTRTGEAELAPLVPTGREALALAWSYVLAIGRDSIQTVDLLRGICVPGWTIGARALVSLGQVPDWSPALWQEAPGADAYRRIPFDEPLRQTLRHAHRVADRVGRDSVGTEHLVLGVAEADGEALGAFFGKQVGAEQVLDAVTVAITGAEKAQDAEARRRGWRPEEKVGRGDLIDRLLVGAREVAEKAGEPGAESGSEPSCWPGLLAGILINEDEDLASLLDDMLLEPEQIHAEAKGLADPPLADAITTAEAHRERAEIELVDLILAIVAVDSPRIRTALDNLGLTPNEVRAQLSEWRLRRDGDTAGEPSIISMAGVNLLFGMVTTVALLQAVASQGAWWKLIFLPLIWTGYPNYGPFGATVIAAVLGVAVSPLVGLLHLLGIPTEVAQARNERQALWARTGVYLNLREMCCVARRRLLLIGRDNQGVRQIVRASLPARLRHVRLLRRRG